ncbi:hypothetical protein LNAOJCKE_4080 [Methylorubrum aminovorans]|uniref:Uncharacterized protein n=1 Tax=Methylorubrum aminovorans TaxID=269069 RepID=A0ABQ4UHT3_9HYPH|nr:hypothetical protein [Methylorubrum aminovorans]GJE66856.1 hypothetical protein LNAOJCKE_4080 [Methylorubrum aminovorans]GMA74936.1 hypothetical protein GCM10025880_13530 [Methylorubrum aminovorans]
MTQPPAAAAKEALDLSFDLDLPSFFPELAGEWTEPSAEAWDALMRQVTDSEFRDRPLPKVLLPLHGEPLDLTF